MPSPDFSQWPECTGEERWTLLDLMGESMMAGKTLSASDAVCEAESCEEAIQALRELIKKAKEQL